MHDYNDYNEAIGLPKDNETTDLIEFTTLSEWQRSPWKVHDAKSR